MSEVNADTQSADGAAVPDNSASDTNVDAGGVDVGSVDLYSTPPEWLPEKFHVTEGEKFDADASFQKAMESYASLETAMSAGKDKLREEIAAEKNEGVPEKAEDYSVPDFASNPPEGLPEGITVKIPEDDTMLASARKWAHKNGVPNEAFQELVSEYVSSVYSDMPDYEAERQKLGDDAEGRIDRLERKIAANVPKNVYDGLVDSLKMNASMVEALEYMTESWEGGPPRDENSGGDVVTHEDALALMDTDAYRAGDPATHKKVQAIFDRVHGTHAHAGAQRGR